MIQATCDAVRTLTTVLHKNFLVNTNLRANTEESVKFTSFMETE